LNDKPVEVLNKNPLVSKKLSDAILNYMEKYSDARITLWRLNDILINELSGKYKLILQLQGESADIQAKAEQIIDCDFDHIKQGNFEFEFIDFVEVMSEGIELILAGITGFKIEQETVLV
ncbi:hypothetical protein JDS92_23260, partial [Bacillus cereus group sp. N12]|uniref:hypothetical protein n=1 Tax=Bacillus cereus group sp. N12 TaxID=2794586 RepID=UPI0018F34518